MSPTMHDMNSNKVELSGEQTGALEELLKLIDDNRNDVIESEMGMPYEEWPEVSSFFQDLLKTGFGDSAYSYYYDA